MAQTIDVTETNGGVAKTRQVPYEEWAPKLPATKQVDAATYTLLAEDAGKLIVFLQTCTITAPVALGDGFNCKCLAEDGTALTFVGSGTSLRFLPSKAESTSDDWALVSIEYFSTNGNVFVLLCGDLVTI